MSRGVDLYGVKRQGWAPGTPKEVVAAREAPTKRANEASKKCTARRGSRVPACEDKRLLKACYFSFPRLFLRLCRPIIEADRYDFVGMNERGEFIAVKSTLVRLSVMRIATSAACPSVPLA
jgi:hypothetical protein